MAQSMNWPRVTLVTPSYNQAAFLESAIVSVLSQDYPNLEYIVMDGGSSDDSVAIIQRYAHRLAHWESQRDKGQADAIQRGFERATGEILGWLNSDDMLLPGALKRVGKWFSEHPGRDWVVGGSLVVDGEGRLVRSRRGLPESDLGLSVRFERLLFHHCGGFRQPATFWRRSAFLAVGGLDETLRFCMDYDLYLRLAKRHPSGHLPKFLAAFRFHCNSKTSTLPDVCSQENELLWSRYGRYDAPESYRLRVKRREQRLDRCRARLIKLGWWLHLFRDPRLCFAHEHLDLPGA